MKTSGCPRSFPAGGAMRRQRARWYGLESEVTRRVQSSQGSATAQVAGHLCQGCLLDGFPPFFPVGVAVQLPVHVVAQEAQPVRTRQKRAADEAGIETRQILD